MAYATVLDVQERLPRNLIEITAVSQPAQATVQAWINSLSGWIDATLRWKYVLPVTDEEDLELLRPVCSALVAAQVWGVLGGHGSELPAAGPDLRKEAHSLLAYDAKAGRSYLVLPNTALADTGEAAVGQPAGTFTDPDVAGNPPRLFTIGMRF